MDLFAVRSITQRLSHVIETFPFNESTLVCKVGGKMFLLIDIYLQDSLTLKVQPDKATELIELYDWISPGYHMNKVHWISVNLISLQSDPKLISELIQDSYLLVYQKLPKRIQNELKIG